MSNVWVKKITIYIRHHAIKTASVLT